MAHRQISPLWKRQPSSLRLKTLDLEKDWLLFSKLRKWTKIKIAEVYRLTLREIYQLAQKQIATVIRIILSVFSQSKILRLSFSNSFSWLRFYTNSSPHLKIGV
jgi:hypothetical protein